MYAVILVITDSNYVKLQTRQFTVHKISSFIIMCAARYGGDSCNTSEPATCPEGMFCSRSGVCECRAGQMTSDRLFCLRYHQKLVGSSCTAHIDTCYQRAGQCTAFVSPRVSIRRSVCTFTPVTRACTQPLWEARGPACVDVF